MLTAHLTSVTLIPGPATVTAEKNKHKMPRRPHVMTSLNVSKSRLIKKNLDYLQASVFLQTVLTSSAKTFQSRQHVFVSILSEVFFLDMQG